MSELLACPFCGATPAMREQDADEDLIYWVGCSGCGASVDYKYDETDAVKAWNTRTTKETPHG